jgi:hypothetical protein
MEISYLNHASIIVMQGTVKLLIDPWFDGTAFEGGWGLRYYNPEAQNKIKDCTHLWVSHFHQDHFHRPTLQTIIDINPDIIFLGNNSYNFQLDEAAKKFGFKNVTSIYERNPISLSDDFRVTRYPTRGIDNMLLIKAAGVTVLNYNDCRIPPISQKLLKKKFGKIDIFLSNFNHAGKLLLYPFPSPEVIKQKLIKNFAENFRIFDPTYVLPFASYHYYRVPASFHQNEAMLTADDLGTIDTKIQPWKIGDRFIFETRAGTVKTGNDVLPNKLDQLVYKNAFTKEEIINAANKFAGTLKKRFRLFSRFFPALYIQISDTEEIIGFKISKGGFIAEKGTQPHIKAHSEALMNWFGKPFGTDSFVVGAHFDIMNENRIPLKWQIALGILVESKLDLKSMFLMLFSQKGLKFLKNRREELLGHLLQFRLTANYQQDD